MVLQKPFFSLKLPSRIAAGNAYCFFEARKSYDFIASHIDPHFSP
ncbi:MAG: hypothetical protein ACI9XO_002418 [Paraglaciecola sp.]|jgi:hypothetical protein